jgi:hypothetical protein
VQRPADLFPFKVLIGLLLLLITILQSSYLVNGLLALTFRLLRHFNESLYLSLHAVFLLLNDLLELAYFPTN